MCEAKGMSTVGTTAPAAFHRDHDGMSAVVCLQPGKDVFHMGFNCIFCYE
jgi:hypothetical protein